MGGLSASAAAQLLGRSRQGVYKLHKTRERSGFPAGRGSPLRWSSDELVAWQATYEPSKGGGP